MSDVKINADEIPEYAIKRLCELVKRYFENPEVWEDYEKWLAEYKKKKANAAE